MESIKHRFLNSMGNRFAFWQGVGSVLDIGSANIDIESMVQIPKDERSGAEIDAANLRGDWERVGGYLRTSMGEIDKEMEEVEDE